jgi:hypothetical protein
MMLENLLLYEFAVRAGLNFRSVVLLVRNPDYGKLFEWTVFLPVREAVPPGSRCKK